MDYAALRTLIETNPNHTTLSDADMLAWVNEEVISVDKDTVSSGTIFAAILNNRSEWTALSAADREFVKDILYIHSGEGVPTAVGSPARTQLIAILGNATKAELAATISDTVSRAVAAGIPGQIRLGDIEYARTF
jgi:hypothetical protein